MRIAAAQARPVWLDPDATAKKVLDLLAAAGQQRVDLLAFPEAFLSGYPFWVERTGGARFNDARQNEPPRVQWRLSSPGSGCCGVVI